MITQCSYILDYRGQKFATDVQSGVVGWMVTEQKQCPQMISDQAHSGEELRQHIMKSLTLMTTRLPRQSVFSQLKMMEKGTAINPLKTT